MQHDTKIRRTFLGAKLLPLLAVLISICFTSNAYAYMGPGGGISAIGSLIALVSAVLLAIVGFIWYPVKRFLRSRKSKETQLDEKLASKAEKK